MKANFKEVQAKVYDLAGFNVSNFEAETESKDYEACRYALNGLKIITRTSKITPNKTGQFVTFWKRIGGGPIMPFQDTDNFDFYVVVIRYESNFGLFIFPKSVLIEKGIASTEKKEGKRAFRVYPPWDKVISKQAVSTQHWQLNYFYSIDNTIDIRKVKELFGR